jgi:hypothetical protein
VYTCDGSGICWAPVVLLTNESGAAVALDTYSVTLNVTTSVGVIESGKYTVSRTYRPGPHVASVSGQKMRTPRKTDPPRARDAAKLMKLNCFLVLSKTGASGKPDADLEGVCVREGDCVRVAERVCVREGVNVPVWELVIVTEIDGTCVLVKVGDSLCVPLNEGDWLGDVDCELEREDVWLCDLDWLAEPDWLGESDWLDELDWLDDWLWLGEADWELDMDWLPDPDGLGVAAHNRFCPAISTPP